MLIEHQDQSGSAHAEIAGRVSPFKKIAFITQGCRANSADSGWLSVLAQKKSFQLVDEPSEADAVIVNTCTVTHGAVRDCRQAVRRVRRLNPEALVCLIGCWTQTAQEDALALEGVDYVGGAGAKERVLDFIESTNARQAAPYNDQETFVRQGFLREHEIPESERHTRLFLKIQDGCDHRCTYCIIHQARGKSQSLSLESVMSLIHQAEERGYREVVLTGIDLGDFGGGVFEPNGLVALVKRIDRESSLERVRLSSLSPREIPDELLDVMASSKRWCPSFHISLQHGSRRLLKAMARPYGPELFRDRVEAIMRRMPQATISFDVIVGFPGEDAEAHEELLQLLRSTSWTWGHFFPYSPRPGTPSATMKGHVSSTLKSQRMDQLLDLSDERLLSILRSWIGKSVDVLTERAEYSAAGEKRIVGLTREFLPVILEGAVGVGENETVSAIVTDVALEPMNHRLVARIARTQ